MPESALSSKLKMRPAHRVKLINAPPGYAAVLGPLPAGAPEVDRPDGPVDFVQLFVRDSQELEKLASAAVKAVKYDGLLWVCYPKGGSKVKSDLNRGILRETMKGYGQTAVSLVSIDETWSAMRFRPLGRAGR